MQTAPLMPPQKDPPAEENKLSPDTNKPRPLPIIRDYASL